MHYAVARRNQILVEKLITTCNANVNGGHSARPSVLDIVQYNREQQKPCERTKDDEIEQLLLRNNAKNRCTIRRVINKRKGPADHEESVVSNLACLSIDLPTNPDLETARSHARMAAILNDRGDTHGAEQSYQQAMMYTPNDTVDWAIYACRLADIYITRDNQSCAVGLLQRAIDIRKQLENQTEEINQIQEVIDRIRS